MSSRRFQRHWSRLAILGMAQVCASAQTGGVASPRFVVEIFGSSRGLPQNAAYAVAQAPDGYIWSGSAFGAARYDGSRFQIFDTTSNPGLPSPIVYALAPHPEGGVWIGTMLGLVHAGRASWRRYGESEGWPVDAAPRNVVRDRKGAWLVGTAGGTVYRLADGRFTRFAEPEGAGSQDSFLSLTASPDGTIWASTHTGLFRLEGEAWNSIPGPRRASLSDWVAIGPARNGGLWAADRTTLYRFEAGKWREVFRRLADPSDLGEICEDSRGGVWLATRRGGVTYAAAGSSRGIKVPGLDPNLARACVVDAEDGVWVALDAVGIARLAIGRVAVLDVPAGLPNDNVKSISVRPGGGLLLGLHERGAIEVGEAGGVTRSGPVQNRPVWSVLGARDGSTWVAPYRHAVLRNGKALDLPIPSRPEVYAMFEDSKNRVWIGGSFGVVVVERGVARKIERERPPAPQNVRAFAEGKGGEIWVGDVDHGLFQATGRGLERAAAASVENTGGILSLYVDATGALWLGTFGRGLIRFHDGRLTSFLGPNRVAARHIAAMIEDDKGFLWCGTPNGLLRVWTESLRAVADGRATRLDQLVLGSADGLAGVECSTGFQPAVTRDRRGRLWFATLRGAAMVDPGNLRINATPPPVRVQRIVASADRETKEFEPGEGVVEIPPGNWRVELQYTALTFSAPEAIQFDYRLSREGDWQSLGSRRTLFFDRPAPGDYHFEVRAANSDGIWNEAGSTVDFRILPRFYQMTSFIVLCVASGLALAVWLTIKWSRRRQERQRRELVAMRELAAERERHVETLRALSTRQVAVREEERSRIAREIHDELGQQLTVLKFDLAALSRTAGQATGNGAPMSERIAGIGSHLDTAIGTVRRIATDLRPSVLDHFGLAAAIENHAAEFQKRTGIVCRCEDLDERELTKEMATTVFRIFQESLTNVARHAKASKVDVTLGVTGGRFELRVKDNGIGVNAGDITQSRSLGILGMAERARVLGGEVSVAGGPGQGTLVRASFPVPSPVEAASENGQGRP